MFLWDIVEGDEGLDFRVVRGSLFLERIILEVEVCRLDSVVRDL